MSHPVLELSEVTFRRQGKEILHGIDLTVRAGEQLERTYALIADVGLAGREERRWPTMSQGERGRALIARALIAEPQLLLLDEPSTGLDVAAREQLLATVGDLVRTHPTLASVLVTHHLEELPVTTSHALVIAHGRVVASGEVGATVTTENISRAFEHPIRVERDRGRWSARSAWHDVEDDADEESVA